MPSLFSLPGPRSGPNNLSSEVLLASSTSTVIAAGSTVYASLFHMYWSDHNVSVDFTNNGILWNVRSTDTTSVVGGFYLRDVTNTGLIVADAQNGNAYAISNGGGWPSRSVINSGQIYAIANGNAIAVEHWNPDAIIINGGLIAAYAPAASTSASGGGGVGGAVGVAMYNGGTLLNNVGASILAEGLEVSAVTYGRGSLFPDNFIRNEGRIEAVSTGSGRSIGISAGGYEVEMIRFVNSGLLKATVAWSSYSPDQTYGPKATDLLTNEASGQIIGRVETGAGNDVLINHGLIDGDVAMGDDDDRLDTTDGRITGSIDLGWGNDLFYGSEETDVVNGGRNTDTLYGAGGNDLLLGGAGADHIEGGDGNDGLYGESGNDLIVTRGGDAAFGGEGDDVIKAGDLSFALISGGGGNDVLELTGGPMRLDLAAAVASGRIVGIETIALQADQQLAVRGGDAANLAGGTLTIIGTASDQLILIGGWTEGSSTVSGGTAMRTFSLAGETVLVAPGVAVQVAAQAPVGFTGLDAIAGGAAAPLAGSLPGGALSDPVTTVSYRYIQSHTLTIDSGETFRATDTTAIIGYSLSSGLVNAGTIEMSMNNATSGHSAIDNDVAFITNSGTIRTGGNQGSTAINIRGSVTNTGTIDAASDREFANAVLINSSLTRLQIDNQGLISARAQAAAVAVQIYSPSIMETGPIGLNSGRIEAIGGSGTIALKVLSIGTFVNSGSIVASNTAQSGASDAIGVLLWNNGFAFDWQTNVNQFVNNGYISGATAVYSESGNDEVLNSGQIDGLITLGTGSDIVENNGTISSRVSLGDGNDGYFGIAAKAAADVAGGNGNDGLAGGQWNDHLDGGAGDDVLYGNGGADQLVGGSGADRFVYSSVLDSSGTAIDSILDFQSGVDRIDLSAIAPSSIDLTAANGITTLTAHTAAGDLLIHITGTISLSDIDVAARAGGAGSDILIGTVGNDRLDGGAGADIMYGGAGNDTYIVDNTNDRVIERDGNGVDEIISSVSYRLPDEVENGTLLAATFLYGNALDNTLRGSAGDDQLFGGDGNDILIGGGGADALFGGQGSDVFAFLAASDSTATAFDTISGFEYGVDKIDLSALSVRSVAWHRVQTLFDSYEEVDVLTTRGTLVFHVSISNVATSGLRMSDFNLPDLVTSPTAADDFNGDGRSDVLLRNNDGRLTNWLGNLDGTFASNHQTALYSVPVEWKIATTADFNGDGITDILYRNDNGSLTQWLGQSGGTFIWNAAASYPLDPSWTVAASGDFNGDGRADIVLRNSNGLLTEWLGKADGTFFSNDAVATYSLPSSWKVAGAGDFNGDGRADLLLRNDNGTITEWLGQSNGSFAWNSAAIYTLSTDWKIAGIGDVNGDGRDDLVLHNAGSGLIVDWLGEAPGTFFSNHAATTYSLPTDWHIANVGDFNGDGRADLLLRNDNGTITEWLGESGGTFGWNQNAIYALATEWHS